MICESVISWPDLLRASFSRKRAIHHAALEGAYCPKVALGSVHSRMRQQMRARVGSRLLAVHATSMS